MPDVWPVTIWTPEGDFVQVDFTPSGRVYLCTSYQGAWLDDARYEQVAQAIIAAKWAAEGRVSHG